MRTTIVIIAITGFVSGGGLMTTSVNAYTERAFIQFAGSKKAGDSGTSSPAKRKVLFQSKTTGDVGLKTRNNGSKSK